MRYLVLSDIHANLAALQAVLSDAPSFDQIWCLGDVVGYGPNPRECIGLLREYDHQAVAGNHDWASIDLLDLSDFNADARRMALWTHDQLAPADIEYLQKLPLRFEDGAWTIVHGSPRHPIWEYTLYASVAAASFPEFTTSYCLVGHTHVPAVFRETPGGAEPADGLLVPNVATPLGEARLIVNPGSVGQPRDRDPRASYLLLDTVANTALYRRTAYSIEDTQEQMEELDLPRRLISRLAHGW